MKLIVNTDQEAFDAVVRHLRAQNRQASWDGACVYRSQAGTSCAIGGLISADDYHPSIEGKTVREMIDDGTLVTDVDPYLLQRLQSMHDDSESWSNTEKMAWVSAQGIAKLREIAARFHLDGSIIDQQFVWKTGNEISGLRQ